MNNNFLSNKIITWIICILIALCVICLICGCKCLPFWNNKPIQIDPVPKPTEQLWNVVKKATSTTSFAIPIIALGAVVMFNGMMKLGMSAIIFGSVNLFMSLASARFAFGMAILGFVGSCVAVIASILIKNKALKDIICNIQKIKDIAKDNGNSISGNVIKETLLKQEKSTQKLVQNIKNNLKLKKII